MARIRQNSLVDRGHSQDSTFAQPNIRRHVGDEEAKQHDKTLKTSREARSTSYQNDCGSESESSTSLKIPKPKATSFEAGKIRQIKLAPLRDLTYPISIPQDKQGIKDIPKYERIKDQSAFAITKKPKIALSGKERIPGKTVANADSDAKTCRRLYETSSESEDSENKLLDLKKIVRRPGSENQTQQNKYLCPLPPTEDASILEIDATEFAKSKLDDRAAINSRPQSSSDKENVGAFLQFSPPRLCKSPQRHSPDIPLTPPQSPSKSRLQSPSKTRTRVPTPPLRPSLDAFWNSRTINDWNDEYSPQKPLKSPRKPKLLQESADLPPKPSLTKAQSPSKRTKVEIDAKKRFDDRKHKAAEDFLVELDDTVTGGKVMQLAAPTGGVKIVWSKTLNSTAGRANWRRESTKTCKQDGTTETTHKHYAFIELAEKVIDDEERLFNVIAHEFCHLCNFMISGIKNQPHGAQFKAWGRKCTEAFGHRSIKVTTKHTYQIDYKYIWQCSNEDCAVEFKRHSKSIDPRRHTCGRCKSKLVQIKPVPRKNGTNENSYAAFVRKHFANIKQSMPEASQKEVMEAIGRKYRTEKAQNAATGTTQSGGTVAIVAETPISTEGDEDMDKVAQLLELVKID